MRLSARRPVALLLLAFATVLAASSSGATPTHSGGLIQGDVDCSQDVDAVDGLRILRVVAGLDASLACAAVADVNCDLAVDAIDALGIQRFVAGLAVSQDEPCTDIGDAVEGASFLIDAKVKPLYDELPGLDGGPSRPVGAAVGPDGSSDSYVTNEIVFDPENEGDLQEFLDEYGGTVIRDGVTRLPGGDVGRSELEEIDHGFYLIHVDPQMSPLDDLVQNMGEAGITGRMTFSSEDAARIAALQLREEGAAADFVLQFTASSLEHPENGGGNIDASKWDFYTDDDNPTLAGDQGLSTGVTRAWDYMKYQNFPPLGGGTFRPSYVAIIDGGFRLNETTGVPLDGNLDYFYTGTAPRQSDATNYDLTAGGDNPLECSGGNPCPYHGNSAFGVCCARPKNGYGSAGVGSDVVFPVLIKVDPSMYVIAEGIRYAALWQADVVSLSLGGDCATLCDLAPDSHMQQSIYWVVDFDGIPLAAAGNDQIDISGRDMYPCKLEHVICVGAVTDAGDNFYNWGAGVDIWAPFGLWTTPDPDSLAFDADNTGLDELDFFGGTSSSTPFVAGVVALMKVLNNGLKPWNVQDMLRQTANASTDTLVTHGYVDALRAVIAARANQPPTVLLEEPGGSDGYRFPRMRALVTDPDPGSGLPLFDGLTTVQFSSDIDGLVCSTTTITYRGQVGGYECTPDHMTPGAHQITARAIDPFGAEASAGRAVSFYNTAPIIDLIDPDDGETFYATQLIDFGAYIFDPDEVPFPTASTAWSSDLQGVIGQGSTFSNLLVEGEHTITITATDEKGAQTQVSFTLNIESGLGVPVVGISSPADGFLTFPGDPINFTGFANDPEDGPLTGASLEWHSDIDGLLGTGGSITVGLSGPPVPCNPESIPHTITLTATDIDGHSVSDEITVWIGIIC